MFGDGERSALVLIVGEQPGDQEGRQGHSFIGPAGKVLTRALEDAGIDPKQTSATAEDRDAVCPGLVADLCLAMQALGKSPGG
ncbi:uracil-DNA glycosylase family protein [Streptomyces sp. SCSIO 30461]|uniref:uracil-DNA glycosylase family protein n=1 Tax=Streptomyces sp. SCSIO 30461 TaxID=3118085 RepID=UPI00387EC386